MTDVAERLRWVCPSCNRAFKIAAGKEPPKLCGECTINPPPVVVTPPAAKAVPPAAAAPLVLAVVLPQPDDNDFALRVERAAERAFYADLAWSVTSFWFVVLFLPGSLASFFIHPILGGGLLIAFVAIWVRLVQPADFALRKIKIAQDPPDEKPPKVKPGAF